MKIIKPSVKILTDINEKKILKHIEFCGRTCYKSEDKITYDSAKSFVIKLIRNKHLAMLEHYSISVLAICDRGVSHEIVRHRIASYAQSSTRYCNFSHDKFNNEVTFIEPCFWDADNNKDINKYAVWKTCCTMSEQVYIKLIKIGATAEEARLALNNSTATEIVITMNLREWIHFFNLRFFGTTGKPHPQMTELAGLIYNEFYALLPTIFNGGLCHE